MDKEKREPERSKGRTRAAQGKLVVPEVLRRSSVQRVLMLAWFALLVALLLTPSFIVEAPFYQLGDIASQNIKAKRDFLVEDREATAKKREEAARQAPVVYDQDDSVAQRLIARLDAAFEAMRQDLSGLNPLVDQEREPAASLLVSTSQHAAASEADDRQDQLSQKKKDFETILGLQVSEQVFSFLAEKQFSKEIQGRIGQLLKIVCDQGLVSSKAKLPQGQG